MLSFYHDAALTVANKQNNPKRFLVPLKGVTGKTSVVYLADPYIAKLTVAASIGATTLHLNKTDEFLNSGTVRIVSNNVNYTITYTSKTISTLEGVSGVSAALNIGDTAKPWKVYKATGNFTFLPRGADLSNLNVALGSSSGNFNFPGSILIISKNTYDTVLDQPIPIYIAVSCLSGIQSEFTNWNITTNPIYTRDKNDSTAISASEVGNSIVTYGYLFRRNNYQIVSLRLLPNSRKVTENSPGFILGSYRWRDSNSINSQVVLKTKWNPDVEAIGLNNFISGISSGDDLKPIDIENVDNSIFLRIRNGFYFIGPTRYFLPATAQIQFINSSQSSVTLTPIPNQGLPVFVGVWELDINKFYRTKVEYRYQASGNFNIDSSAPEYQYTLNKQTNYLTVNVNLQPTVYFLGTLSGESVDYFDLPVYPVDSIASIYIDRGSGNQNIYSSNFIFNRDLGTVKIEAPTSGLETSIPNTYIGEPVYALCNPAYAVVYDSGDSDQKLLSTIDLNPAFAGISSGYVYLQHRRQKPTSLVLSSDKALIDIPATYTSIIDLIAYGPIYFDGDYSLLTVQATGPINGEPIPNATIEIIPGDNFSGTINYKDPTTTTVSGITGSDGKVNFLYLPNNNYGYYIPTSIPTGSLSGITTTNVSNDTIILPTSIAISEVFNTKEGWLVGTYNVKNNDPLFGMVGADITKGQLPFISSGTTGTISYKTNGEKNLWANGNVGIQPIDARDVNNISYTNSSFNGQVVKLIYPQSLVSTNIGSYFITFLQRVSVQARYVDSDVVSNIILLEMALSNPINQNPWLILNSSTQGRLNQYRLGWQQDLPNSL